MKINKNFILFLVFAISSTHYSFSQNGENLCSIDVQGDNNGTIVQNNNTGDVYITFVGFDVTKDQLIISIGKDIKNTQPKEIATSFKQKEQDFKPLPIKSAEAIKQIEVAKQIILPAMAQAKSTVCFEDLINDAIQNGKIQVQQADSSYTRLVIGDAERLLGDFVIYFDMNNSMRRVKENGKYYYEEYSKWCLKKNNNCLYFDFASDFLDFDCAIVGDKIGDSKFQYYFINRKGEKKESNTFKEFKKVEAGSKQVLIVKNENEKCIFYSLEGVQKTGEFNVVSNLLIQNKSFYQISINGYIGLISLDYLKHYQEGIDSSLVVLEATNIQEIGEIFDTPKHLIKDSWYHVDVLANIKINNKWNLARLTLSKDINSKFNIEILIKNQLKQIKLLKEDKKNPEIFRFESNGKYGLLNFKSKIFIEPNYSAISEFDVQGFATLSIGSKNQYTNRNMEIAASQFNQLTNIDGTNFAQITLDGKKGLINILNKEIIVNPEYDKIELMPPYEFAYVKKGILWGVQGVKIEEIRIEAKYFSISKFGERQFIFNENEYGNWGLINYSGKESLLHKRKDKGQITQCNASDELKVAVLAGSLNYSGIINETGEYIYQGEIGNKPNVKFYKITTIGAEPLFCVEIYTLYQEDGGKVKRLVFIKGNKLFLIVNNKRFDEVKESLAYSKYKLIKTDGNGYVDLNGKYIVEDGNLSLEDYNEFGYVWATNKNKIFVLYNKFGVKVTNRDFEGHGKMNIDFIVPVQSGGKWGYIQIVSGNFMTELVKCKYTFASEVINNYAIIGTSDYGGMKGIINMSDYILAPFIFLDITRNGDKFEVKTYGYEKFTLQQSNEQGLKRFKCVSGDCEKYEKLAKEFYEKR